MRNPALIVGALLLVFGGLILTGVFKTRTTEKVADIGPLEITKTETKSPPVNYGWILVSVGAIAVVAGALSKKK